jgi:chitinase
VAFYNGSSLLGTVSQAPYTLAAGNYSISAQAADSERAVSGTPAVNVTVDNAPSFSLQCL